MNTILNFIRFFIAGWWQWLFFMLLAFISSITVVLLPLAKSFREIAKLLIMPFGKEIIRNNDMGTYHKSFGVIFNIIWFPIGVILSIFYFISGIILFLTILGIPAGVVSIKLAKIIILPIGVRVLTKKEYIQEMVKEEIKKQGGQNNNENSLPIQNINSNILTNNENNYKKSTKEINADDVFKPFRVIFFILFNVVYIVIAYIAIKYFSDFNKYFYLFVSVLFFVILIIQTGLYLIAKFNLQNKISVIRIKYNYEILLFAVSIIYVILANIFILIYSFGESSGILSFLISVLKYNILFLLYHYFLIILSFKNFGGFDELILELEKYKSIEQIKEYVIKIQEYIVRYNEKRKTEESNIVTNQ